MTRRIEFYFAFGSPYSYLAETQLKELAADTKATIYMPINVLDLMKATGNTPTTIERKSKEDTRRAICNVGSKIRRRLGALSPAIRSVLALDL
jgi:2-hydroxychromene-2-carboxylate isomerase